MITTPLPQDDVLLMLAGKFHVNTTRIPDLKTIYHTNKLNTQKLFDAINMLVEGEKLMMFNFVGAVVGGFVSDVPSPMPSLKQI